MKNKILLTSLLGLFSAVTRRGVPYRRVVWELARLKGALLYLRAIETARLLFLSFWGIGVCLVLLVGGLALFHATVFFYAPWSDQIKMYVNFFFAFLYLAAGAGAFFYVFAHAKWLEIFYANRIIEDLSSPDGKTEPTVAARPRGLGPGEEKHDESVVQSQ